MSVKIPRLSFDRLPPPIAAALRPKYERLGYHQAVAVLMVMGRYTTHAIIVNSLGIVAPVPSIFEDGFAG